MDTVGMIWGKHKKIHRRWNWLGTNEEEEKKKHYRRGLEAEDEREVEPVTAVPVYGGPVRLCFTNNFSLNTANRVSH